MIGKFFSRKKEKAQAIKPQPKEVLIKMINSQKFNSRYNILQYKDKGVKAIAKKIYIESTPYKNSITKDRVFKLILDVEWIGAFGCVVQRHSYAIQANREWILMDDYVFDEKIDLLQEVL